MHYSSSSSSSTITDQFLVAIGSICCKLTYYSAATYAYALVTDVFFSFLCTQTKTNNC